MQRQGSRGDDHARYVVFVPGALEHEGVGSRNVAVIGPESSFGRAIATMRARSSGTVGYDDGGIHYMARFRSDPLTGWQLVIAWPQ